MSKKTQAVVIGAGPGGYVAAIRLGQLGVKAILVEKEFVGGVCLNVGCIPSKALIYASHVVDLAKKASRLGIELSEPRVDPVKMQEWKKGVVKKLTSGLEQVIRGNGSEILRGEARLRSQREVEVKTSQGTETLLAEHIVVATGARPAELPDFPCDGDLIIHSTHALELQEIPKRMLVIGGGYIGLELGSLYAKLGTKVTVVEMMDQLLPGFDPEIVRIVAQKLRRSDVAYHVRSRVKGLERTQSGAKVVLELEGKEKTLEVDRILVTVGRKPNSGGLGLEGAGVKVSDRGYIPVDEKLRTNVKTIYAVGDVAGEPLLAHKAFKEGEVVAEVIAGRESALDYRAMPAVVFTDPEIATVGLSEAEARLKGHDVIVGKFPFAANGRALGTLESDGFVKVVAERSHKEILGVQIVGPGASDLISEAALGLEMGASLEDIALTVHPHPTLSECMTEACKAALGEPLHILSK